MRSHDTLRVNAVAKTRVLFPDKQDLVSYSFVFDITVTNPLTVTPERYAAPTKTLH